MADEKKPTRKKKAADDEKKTVPEIKLTIQSTMGGEITIQQILAKIPQDTVRVYIKTEENKAYWVSEGSAGSVIIWE